MHPYSVVLFRGRRTAQIRSQLEADLVVPPLAIAVVASAGDAMREDSDVLPGGIPAGDLLVVANGGTTSPLVKVVAHLAYRAGLAAAAATSRVGSLYPSPGDSPEVQIWDLQRDGAFLRWAEPGRDEVGFVRARSVWFAPWPPLAP